MCSSSLESNGRLRARGSPVHQEVLGNSPLPLGEGQGEGLATKLRKYFFLLLLGTGQEKGWRRVFFSCYSAKPSPQPSPKGRGSYLEIPRIGGSPYSCASINSSTSSNNATLPSANSAAPETPGQRAPCRPRLRTKVSCFPSIRSTAIAICISLPLPLFR